MYQHSMFWKGNLQEDVSARYSLFVLTRRKTTISQSTGGCKILFNLGNKFHKFYTSMINGAINVFIRVCMFVGGGWGDGWGLLLKTFIDHEN